MVDLGALRRRGGGGPALGPRKNPDARHKVSGAGGGGAGEAGNQETLESPRWESLGYKAGTMTGSLGYRSS